MEKKSLANQTPRETLNNIKDGTFFKELFKGTSRSAYFWNGLAWLIFIATMFINIEITIGISSVLSLFLVGCAFDDMFEKEPNKHYWPPMSFLFWLVLLIFGIISGIYGLYTITIKPFNAWLNDPYAKDWEKFNAYISNPTIENRALHKEFYEEYNKHDLYKEQLYRLKPRFWNKRLKQVNSLDGNMLQYDDRQWVGKHIYKEQNYRQRN